MATFVEQLIAAPAGTLFRMSSRDTPAQIGDLPPLGRPANNALLQADITTLDQVASHASSELLALHGVGPRAIRLLEAALEERGLKFAEAS
jgi:hypothetical protein